MPGFEELTKQVGGKNKHNLGDSFCMFVILMGTMLKGIGLKALGNDLDQFWSNKVMVFLCEGPKPAKSMIS